MTDPAHLLQRLDEIGASLASEPTALALLGLGSVGEEVDRLDEFSDLDFFVIVEAGAKSAYLEDLQWMERIHPLAFAFRNTIDGHKVLFDDDVFCEYAVFEPDELADIAFVGPRVVWASERFDRTQILPPERHDTVGSSSAATSVDDLAAEALTNLYVGMLREQRGERLAAVRMIQGHAVDRAMEIVERLDAGEDVAVDPFGLERRFELRHPTHAQSVAEWTPGYHHNRRAAAALLASLERMATLSQPLADRVRCMLEDR